MRSYKNPMVSVVIPTFNHGCYLRRALQSVLAQTYTDWEIIVVDNQSTDDTDEVINEFDDKNIRHLKIANRGVIAASRNLGIKSAKGVWIAFLDSDDFWDRGKLEQCLKNTDPDFIYHRMRCYRIAHNNSITTRGELSCRDVTNKPYSELFDNGPSPQTSSVVIRKSCLEKVGGFDENKELIGGEDFDLWLRLAKNGDKFFFIDLKLGCYLTNGTHTTSPEKGLKIIAELCRKYCDGSFSKCPDWMHKTNIASYLKLRQFCNLVTYASKLLFKLPLTRVMNILTLLIRAKLGA